jgi:hypoxanthine-guanine phosphoribosyltransferase
MKLISLDDIEDSVDDMAELLEESNEIQEVCAAFLISGACYFSADLLTAPHIRTGAGTKLWHRGRRRLGGP